jgi:hypothetical protein
MLSDNSYVFDNIVKTPEFLVMPSLFRAYRYLKHLVSPHYDVEEYL